MEKASLLSRPRPQSALRPLAAFCLVILLIRHAITWRQGIPTAPAQFSWDDIEPSASLEFVPCFARFQCARLSVPLNWNASAAERAAGPRAALAVIKLPAAVPVTDPRYGGPVVLNPGGPGESGVYQVLSDGASVREILDGDRRFDVLSFDPRGVNNTTPSLRCFPSGADQAAWLAGLPDYGLLWHSESVVGLEWARAAALGAACSREEGGDGILRHANTAQTVEDMVHLVEEAGAWREREARRLGGDTRRLAHRPGRERLQFWGMSYGTVIGATFAALHPERVGRMVLDGVVDPADHYAGGWLTQLQDSDGIVSKFCEYCSRAGPQCPLYADTPEGVEERLTATLTSLKEDPIPLTLPSGAPALITYGDAHLQLLSAMYFPFAAVGGFFGVLRSLEARNASSPDLIDIAVRKQAQAAERPDRTPYVSGMGPVQAIACMDAGGTNLTREAFGEYLTELQTQGRWVSPSWARNKLGCLGYSVQPAWRPPLTFEAQEWANTSHPLLVLGNSHDPVTPLRNARRVNGLFPGSAVLRQDSEGHCSHSSPSLCTGRAVRAYFQTGALPAEGAVCEPETRPFLGCSGDCEFDADDARLWAAMKELADPFGVGSH